jgi:predicted nucleotidyltransferase
MRESQRTQLCSFLETIPEVKLAYLFGSRATQTSGSLSDYDFAFYLDCHDRVKINKIRSLLIDNISQILKTNQVDIVILNLLQGPELKYSIIREGGLFFEKEPFKLLVEPVILSEYFDFRSLLERHHLTRKE